MASKSTYECYVCKKNGFANVRVYLDGKTEDGKTIYKNEDMSPHYHQARSPTAEQVVHGQQQQQQQPTGSTTVVSESTQLKMINAKIDRLISLMTELTEFVSPIVEDKEHKSNNDK